LLDIDRDFWSSKRVLVTGHTGFMGGWLAVVLAEFGATVYGYSLAPPTTPSFFEMVGVGRIIAGDVRADVRDRETLRHALREYAPDIVLHLAAQPIVREALRNPLETLDTNVMGTVNVLEAARVEAGVRALIIVTSDKVYDNVEWEWEYREDDRLGGREPYGVSKACAELVVNAYRSSFMTRAGTGLATVRAGNIIGGGDWGCDRLVPDMVRAFSTGTVLRVRNPNATRPWQHVLEPVHGYLLLAQKLFADPQAFSSGWNLGPSRADNKPVSWLADTCAQLWGGGARWETDSSEHPYEAMRLGVTCAKAELSLGWRPRWRLDEALPRTINWYRAAFAGHDMLSETQSEVRQFFSTS
jgi:CDP-glucose 4,6-dehydratase